MRRKITFLLTFLVAVLIIALAGGRVYADTGYEVEDYAMLIRIQAMKQ